MKQRWQHQFAVYKQILACTLGAVKPLLHSPACGYTIQGETVVHLGNPIIELATLDVNLSLVISVSVVFIIDD